jgi:hypothetical protein
LSYFNKDSMPWFYFGGSTGSDELKDLKFNPNAFNGSRLLS